MFEYEVLKREGGNSSGNDEFAQAVLKGLSLKEKRLPSWLIFDGRGSEIFKEITELPEYLPAACEFEIFRTHKQTITHFFRKEPSQIIELGCGDGGKTKILIENIINNQIDLHYYPIDISNGAIINLVKNLKLKYINKLKIKKSKNLNYYFCNLLINIKNFYLIKRNLIRKT